MNASKQTSSSPWGNPPWEVEFKPAAHPIPEKIDIAIIGGGFTGLAAAAWLRLLAPEKTVAVFEASGIGAGASGRTGGMALAGTAAGDLPGLGDVLAGFQDILKKLNVVCDLSLPGAWEIGRSGGGARSPIEWDDSGTLRAVHEVPGGTLDPGKLVGGLASAAEFRGALIFENMPVARIDWSGTPELSFTGNPAGATAVRAGKVLLATNALSLSLAGIGPGAHPRLTLAALTAPISDENLEAAGLGARIPFYTVDLPYLWGRVRADNSIIWGAGLVSAPDELDVAQVDIGRAESGEMFQALERRVRNLHPALRDVSFTHRWGGPILFREGWVPVFGWHPASRNGIVVGAFAGHGVALSSYLGAWAAELFLGRRDLPPWGSLEV